MYQILSMTPKAMLSVLQIPQHKDYMPIILTFEHAMLAYSHNKSVKYVH